MRKVKRSLPHPVTGEMKYFWLESPADVKEFEATRKAWGDIARRQVAPSGQDATAVEPANRKQVVTAGGIKPSANLPARAYERPKITDEESLRSMAPAGMASLASLVPGVRYGALLRTLLASGLGAAGSRISGTDPMQEAITQGAMQIPGEAIMGVQRGLGRGAMRKPLNADPDINQSFGDVGGSALRERIGVANPRTLSEGPEKAGLGEKMLGNMGPLTGSAEASRRMDELKGRIIPKLAADKTMHDPNAIFNEVRNRIRAQLSKQTTGRRAHLDAVDQVIADAKLDPMNTQAWDNVSAWERKQGAQQKGHELLKDRSRIKASSGAEDIAADAEMLFNVELQNVLNERLMKIPGYRSMATRFRELEGVRRAMLDAEVGRDATASPRAVGGGGNPRVALNPVEMLSPQAFTTMGRALDHPASTFAGGNLPRGLLEAMRMGDPTMDPMDVFRRNRGGQP